jgi:hypothetical protein
MVEELAPGCRIELVKRVEWGVARCAGALGSQAECVVDQTPKMSGWQTPTSWRMNYQHYLPTEEELRAEVTRSREAVEQRIALTGGDQDDAQ